MTSSEGIVFELRRHRLALAIGFDGFMELDMSGPEGFKAVLGAEARGRGYLQLDASRTKIFI